MPLSTNTKNYTPEILKVNNEAMNSFIELIQKIGAYQIRVALDLLTDEDIDELEDEE